MLSRKSFYLISILAAFLFGPKVFAAGQGGFSLGANIGITTADQSDMNTLRERANERASVSTSELGNAWEGGVLMSYRSAGTLAVQLHSSMFYQAEDGKSSLGKHEYSVTGWTVFPMLRFYLLEDNYIKFFTQLGVGWGFLTGSIREGDNKAEFDGNAFGYMAGLGAEFCIFGSSHCITVEGNFRYLAIERVVADSISGDFSTSTNPDSLSQASEDDEVELDNKDFGMTASGMVMKLGYVYYF